MMGKYGHHTTSQRLVISKRRDRLIAIRLQDFGWAKSRNLYAEPTSCYNIIMSTLTTKEQFYWSSSVSRSKAPLPIILDYLGMTSMTQTVTSLPSSTFMSESEWQDSIDQPCGLLKNCYRCWTAKGPAREIFERIAEPIRTVLESRSDDLDRGQIVPHTIGFTLYMISLRVFSSTSVRPTLLIECKNPTVRDRAKSVIKQSRIWCTTLIQHPHLRLATCARGPHQCAGENPRGDYWIWDKDRQDYYHPELDRNGTLPFSLTF